MLSAADLLNFPPLIYLFHKIYKAWGKKKALKVTGCSFAALVVILRYFFQSAAFLVTLCAGVVLIGGLYAGQLRRWALPRETSNSHDTPDIENCLEVVERALATAEIAIADLGEVSSNTSTVARNKNVRFALMWRTVTDAGSGPVVEGFEDLFRQEEPFVKRALANMCAQKVLQVGGIGFHPTADLVMKWWLDCNLPFAEHAHMEQDAEPPLSDVFVCCFLANE